MAGRPAAKAELRRLLARREPLYRRAELRVDTSRLGVDGSVGLIAERLGTASAAKMPCLKHPTERFHTQLSFAALRGFQPSV